MGDRNNKNTRQGFKSNVQVRVQSENVSGSKQGGSGKTQSRSTVNMGVAQKSSSGGGNSQTANKVTMMATNQQTHTTHHNRPQQNHQPLKNHGPQQNRPQQNKVAHKAPCALPQQNDLATSSEQNISINISLASLLANQLQIPNIQQPIQGNQQHNQGNQQHNRGNQQHNQGNKQHNRGNQQHNQGNQQHNQGNQQHNQGNLKQYRNPQQLAAGGNQMKPSQQNPKNAGGQAYTKSSQKVFVNVNTQNKWTINTTIIFTVFSTMAFK